MTLVDTNVLLDIATDDPAWAGWSLRQLDAAAVRGPTFINPVIYSELSIGYSRIEDLDKIVAAVGLTFAHIPRAALFLAGKVFQRYRSRGGKRTGVLPDFFIGAHAAVAALPLLTRDPRRYRTYFSGITLIAPEPD
ncbi:MAG: hypothetical protein OJF62_001617 [Pseudolabrys sp.]|jgi:predicted nucleic acid-binding protein|nr:hypothetical protein [Pseudolabrys sp.]